MRRTLAVCMILLVPLAAVFADTAQVIAQADELHDQGRTILVVAHDDSVAKRADRVVRLLDGEIE